MMTTKEGVPKRPESLWINIKQDDVSVLFLAQILAQKGFKVWISEQAVDEKGKTKVGYVAIHADLDGQDILRLISHTPDMEALCLTIHGFGPPNLDYCHWDDVTKRRVAAYWYQKEAVSYQEQAKPLEEKAKANRAQARKLLGKHKPLTQDEIRSLVEQVVDRVLAQSSKPS